MAPLARLSRPLALLLCLAPLLPCQGGLLARTQADEEESFPAYLVFRTALEASAVGPASRSEAASITELCLTKEKSLAWSKAMDSAMQMMMEKTTRGMQKGLAGLSSSVVDVASNKDCGKLGGLDQLQQLATRLHVLATSRSLAQLNSKVKYEPLQSLTVGEVDVHTEINAVISAWQLRKGPSELGQALMALLNKFADDATSADAEPATLSVAAQSAPIGGASRNAAFWAEAFNAAFKRLGETSSPVSAECLTEDFADRIGKLLDVAFATMMEKNRRSMQRGLKQLSTEMETFLGELTTACTALGASAAAKHMQDAAARLAVLAKVKNLVNPGVHVDYEPMRALTVGGIDVHLELNNMILSWVKRESAEKLGQNMASFFEDFSEKVEPEDKVPEAEAPTEEKKISNMLWDAVQAAQGGTILANKASDCFTTATTAVFVEGINAAIEHMLQKRRKTMQQGLKELADTVDRLLAAQPKSCVDIPGVQAIWSGARKLRTVTRRTVVDYGTHIKYEAMKSLSIGGTALHRELNDFLGAWKLRSPVESGSAFGEFMRKLSTVTGYDEL